VSPVAPGAGRGMFPVTNFNEQARAEQDRYTPSPPADPVQMKLGMTAKADLKPGSLIVADAFLPAMPIMGPFGGGGPVSKAHGELVKSSAEDAGFKGNLVRSPLDHSFTPNPDEMRATELTFQRVSKLAPEEYRKNIAEYAEVSYASTLHQTTERLEGLQEAGTKNSVVNFSQGLSKASLVGKVYSSAYMTPQGLEGAAGAFGLSADKLMSKDPEVSGPERARFQQALTDAVSGSIDNSEKVKAAKATYAGAVRKFEGQNNSVVVSAGNDGDVLKQLQDDANGAKLNVPKDWVDNVLVTPDVTAVGALDQGKAAQYSSKFAEVDVYANGSIEDSKGTSFAAPRVAATMAGLHGTHPELSSSQVENLMKQQFTTERQDLEAPALEVERTREFLSAQKF
jgi:hypothetical protein